MIVFYYNYVNRGCVIRMFLLFLCLPPFCLVQFCPDEEYNDGKLIKWSSSQPGEIISNPPCINNQYEITKRFCTSNGTWVPEKPQCKLVQAPYTLRCPPEFIGFGNFCLYINHSQDGNAKCPLPNFLDIMQEEYLIILHGFNLSNFWLPVKRNQPYGKFIFTHQKYLNQIYTITINYEDLNSDCIVLKSTELRKNNFTYTPKIVDCSSLHTLVCLYEIKDTISISNDKISCPLNEKICYEISKKSCTIAEPETPIDNIVIKNLIKNKKCYFGLERNNQNIFHWPKTNSFLDYTDWLLQTDFNNSISVITKNGWFLDDYNHYDCNICEKNTKDIQTRITLKPSRKKGLILTLYSPELFINNNKVSCSVVGVDDTTIKFDIKHLKKFKYSHDTILGNLSERDNREVYLIKPDTKEYNYYKCEGVVLPNAELISTGYVLYGTKKHEREYAVDVIIQTMCLPPLKCGTIWDTNFIKTLKDIGDIIDDVRYMKILEFQNSWMRAILHIRFKTNFPLPYDYVRVQDELDMALYKLKNIRIKSFRYAWGCLEDVTLNGNMVLHWDFSNFGETIMPKELCVDHNGFPITRKCHGDFISGGEWGKETGICSQYIFHSPTTRRLHELYSGGSGDVLKDLMEITEGNPEYIPIDIYYISKIIRNINESVDPGSIIQVISNLMSVDENILVSSSKLLNSTNILLDTFEGLMKRIVGLDLDSKGYVQYISPNIYYQISDISVSNVTGVVMLNNSKNFDYKLLESGTKMEDLLNYKNLEVATFIPDYIIHDIMNSIGLNSTKLFISIFSSNSLFVQNISVFDKIVSVSFIGDENSLSSPIPVIFRNTESEEKRCSYWGFGGSTYGGMYRSEWKSDGGVHMNSSNYEICGFTHLTHFGLLLINPEVYKTDPSINYEVHDYYLSMITIMGCVLSLIGDIIIFIMLVLFKSWRNKIGTKILGNFTLSSFLLIFFFFLADFKLFDDVNCVVVGAGLHYSVVSLFCWMLVIAYLQYLRFVRVIGGMSSHFLLKSCFVGWVIPLIPVVGLLVWNVGGYQPMGEVIESGLCYPHGDVIYITVLLPIFVIVVINLVIFFMILYNVFKETISKNKSTLLIHQLKLGVLLFFLLGIPWIFGILAVTQKCVVCIYLFCLTATLQGFVLFIFCVVLDPKTRKLWLTLFPRSNIHLNTADNNGSSDTQLTKLENITR